MDVRSHRHACVRICVYAQMDSQIYALTSSLFIFALAKKKKITEIEDYNFWWPWPQGHEKWISLWTTPSGIGSQNMDLRVKTVSE